MMEVTILRIHVSSSSVDASLSKFVNLAILVWPMLPVD